MNIIDSILLVTGNHGTKTFGTGFVIYCDSNSTLVVTCQHVVKDIQKHSDVLINHQDPVDSIIFGKNLELDIAILFIKQKLVSSSLKLSTNAKPGNPFTVYGYYLFDSSQNIHRMMPLKGKLMERGYIQPRPRPERIVTLKGKLIEKGWLNLKNRMNKLLTWDLSLDDVNSLQQGYSGSPVVDDLTGSVVGVVSHMLTDTGDRGIAMSTENLSNLFKELPDEIAQNISIHEKKQTKQQILEPTNKVCEISDKINAFEFNSKNNEWRKLSKQSTHLCFNSISYERLKNMFSVFHKPIHIVGLPQVGKTTICKDLLNLTAKTTNFSSYFLSCSEQDYEANLTEILRHRPNSSFQNSQSIFVFDKVTESANLNFKSKTVLHRLKTVLIHNDIKFSSVPLYSDNISFVKPLSNTESLEIHHKILQDHGILLPKSISKQIVEHSGGLPELVTKLTHYYIQNTIYPEINDTERFFLYFNDLFYALKRIEKLGEYNLELLDFIVGMFSTGKSIDQLHRTFELKQKDTSIFLRRLGIDNLIKSSFLRAFFFNVVGFDKKNDFLRNRFAQYVHKVEQKPAIWTNNFDIRFSENIVDYVFNLLKSHTSKVEWNSIKINGLNKPLTYKLQNGDRVSVNLGLRRSKNELKRISNYLSDKTLERFILNPERNQKYHIRRKEQSKLIFEGDLCCKQNDWEKAEELYKKAINIHTDASWASIRLSNLYRVKGQFVKAQTICKNILRSGKNPYAALCSGICYYWSGDIANAIEYFNLAIKYKPHYMNALCWMARSQLHMNSVWLATRYLSEYQDAITNFKVKYRKKYRHQPTFLFLKSLSNNYYGKKDGYDLYLKKVERSIRYIEKTDLKTYRLNQVYPMLCLCFVLKNEIDKYETTLPIAIDICSKYEGIKSDIFLWCQLIPWEDENIKIDRKTFIKSFLSEKEYGPEARCR